MNSFDEWQPTGWADELRAQRVTKRVDFAGRSAQWAAEFPPKQSRFRKNPPEWTAVSVTDASVAGMRIAAQHDAAISVGSVRRIRLDEIIGLVRIVWTGSTVGDEHYYGCEFADSDSELARHIQVEVTDSHRAHA